MNSLDGSEEIHQENDGANKSNKSEPRLIDEDLTGITRIEERRGGQIFNERVRVVLPSRRSFRRISTGLLEATELSQAPQGGAAKFFYNVKRALIGAPLATAQQEHERLTKFKALAVLSSDAISSVAYATEAILITLVAAGSGVLG
ncbi:MAG TPA: hypothetical protein VGT44_17390, partial [Ktedonobacteraceae bacterium]|nr:hypothetical protein [Ktedonobacteraceae bacterium]